MNTFLLIFFATLIGSLIGLELRRREGARDKRLLARELAVWEARQAKIAEDTLERLDKTKPVSMDFLEDESDSDYADLLRHVMQTEAPFPIVESEYEYSEDEEIAYLDRVYADVERRDYQLNGNGLRWYYELNTPEESHE